MKTIKALALCTMLSTFYIQCCFSDSNNNGIDYDRINQELEKKYDKTGLSFIEYTTKKEDTVTYYINGKKVTKEEFDNPKTAGFVKKEDQSNSSNKPQPRMETPTENQPSAPKLRSFNALMADIIKINEKRFKDNSDSDSDDDND
jgi:hypothetical protein